MLTDIPVLIFLIIVMVCLFLASAFSILVQIKSNRFMFDCTAAGITYFVLGYLIYYGISVQTHPADIFLRF